jgi:sugar phosphate isomerase/epimerase
MVLDTAHLYMTSDHEFFENLNYLLDNYIEQISVIHLCDSTMRKDGLGFGEGDIDMEKLIKVVKQKFDGKVTLEVMPEHQEDALRKWNSIS